MRVHHNYGVAVLAFKFAAHLVGDDMLHEGGFPHTGARHIEGVSTQTVVGQEYGFGVGAVGVPDVGTRPGGEHGRKALADVPDNRVAGSDGVGWMPQCSDLGRSEH